MTLTEIFDFVIRQCGQHITTTDNLEIKERPFLDLIEKTLGEYKSYYPLTDTFQLVFNGHRGYTFTRESHKYGIPLKIYSVTPVVFTSRNPLHLHNHFFKYNVRVKNYNPYSKSKTEFPWEYNKDCATLVVPFDGRMTIKATFGYEQKVYVENEFENVLFRSESILNSINDYNIVFNGLSTVKETIDAWLDLNPGADVTYDERYSNEVLGAGTLQFQPTDDKTYDYPTLSIQEHHHFFDMITAEFAEQLGMARDTYTMNNMVIETNADQLRAFAKDLKEKVEEDKFTRGKHHLAYKR